MAGALALKQAILRPNALILLLSPTQRQSSELFRDKVLRNLSGLLAKDASLISIARRTAETLELSNGSRIISLPENESGIRGFSGVNLLVLDEASRVRDALYRAVRPMLAVSQGRLIALSTPFGKRGWFFSEWEGTSAWERVRITAYECPRISREFLREEYKAMGERWFRQEYECDWADAAGAVFSSADIQAALRDTSIEPLIAEDDGIIPQ